MLHNHIKTISHFRFFATCQNVTIEKYNSNTLVTGQRFYRKKEILSINVQCLFFKKMNFPIIEIRLMGLNEKTNALIFAYKHV